MLKNQHASASQAMDAQFREVSALVEEIQTILSQRPGSAPPRVYEQLNRLYESLGRLRKQAVNLEGEWRSLVGMAEVSQAMNSTLELDLVLQIVMDTIIQLTGAERGFLMLRDGDGDMAIRVARNWEQESLDPSEFAISRTVINRVANEGQPVLTTNAQEDPRFGGQQSVVAYNLRSILCAPLKLKNEVIGVIYTDNRIKSGLFTQRHLDSLAAFANQAAIAIDNARLFASVRQTLAEVTELKNLMDNVFFSIASGVVTTDIEERIVLCNRAAENILGRVTGELIGQPLSAVMASLSSTLKPHLNGVLNENAVVTGLEVTSDFADRGPLDLRLNLSPLKDVQQNTQGVAIVMEDLTEKKKLEAQRRLFERMVSPAVINQLNPNSLQLGGKRTEITTLFADIRGFTHFSEALSPEELVSILNCYLKVSAEAVLSEEGTIDKFMGDAIMALFNAPIPQPDHTLRAVRAALAMRAAIHELHNTLPPHQHLNFGAGIHVGEAVLGLIGTERRLDYTAIGDSVNTAKRIQENASAGQILISQPAYLLVADQVEVRPVEPIAAKGKSAPVLAYEILDLK